MYTNTAADQRIWEEQQVAISSSFSSHHMPSSSSLSLLAASQAVSSCSHSPVPRTAFQCQAPETVVTPSSGHGAEATAMNKNHSKVVSKGHLLKDHLLLPFIPATNLRWLITPPILFLQRNSQEELYKGRNNENLFHL